MLNTVCLGAPCGSGCPFPTPRPPRMPAFAAGFPLPSLARNSQPFAPKYSFSIASYGEGGRAERRPDEAWLLSPPIRRVWEVSHFNHNTLTPKITLSPTSPCQALFHALCLLHIPPCLNHLPPQQTVMPQLLAA